MKPLLAIALCCVTAWGQSQFKVCQENEVAIFPPDGEPYCMSSSHNVMLEDRLRAIERRLDELEKYVCENPRGCGPKEVGWAFDVTPLFVERHITLPDVSGWLLNPEQPTITALIEPEPITPFFVNVPWSEWFFVPEPDKVNLIGE